jgi:hypothetical protein
MSIAKRSNNTVNRDLASAYGTLTCCTSVRRALHSRHPGVKIRLELAGVQMTPDAFRSMIV